jgi:hypothetical protein
VSRTSPKLEISPALRQKLNIQPLPEDHPFYRGGSRILVRLPLTQRTPDEFKSLVGRDRQTRRQADHPKAVGRVD